MGTYLNSRSGVTGARVEHTLVPDSVDFAGRVCLQAAWALESADMQFSPIRFGKTRFGKTQLGSRALSPG